MKTVSINSCGDDIRGLVVDWSELMAAGDFDGAHRLLAFDNGEFNWTPESLANTIRGYGIC